MRTHTEHARSTLRWRCQSAPRDDTLPTRPEPHSMSTKPTEPLQKTVHMRGEKRTTHKVTENIDGGNTGPEGQQMGHKSEAESSTAYFSPARGKTTSDTNDAAPRDHHINQKREGKKEPTGNRRETQSTIYHHKRCPKPARYHWVP